MEKARGKWRNRPIPVILICMRFRHNFPAENVLLVFILSLAAWVLFIHPALRDAVTGSEARLSAVGVSSAALAADTVSPRINAVKSSDIGTSSAVIVWQTDEPSDSLVEYGLSISFGFESAFSEALTESHAITLTDLSPETSYYYRVRSKDALRNRATSEEYRVRTLDRPADPDNSILTVTRVLPGQYDDTKYTVSISDSDGLGYVRVETAEGDIIWANNLRYGFYGGIRACPAEPITTDTITLEAGDFPLSGYVIDCAHTGIKYPVKADMPPS